MNNNPIPKRYPLPPPYPPKDHWDYVGQNNLGEVAENPAIATAEWWRDKCQAFFYAGNTLYLWNEASELKLPFLSACDIREGQDIFIIGKYADESGLLPALHSLIGREGKIKSVEIGQQAIDSILRPDPKSGTKMQWDFHYLDSLPDNSLDRVILFSAASHVSNWSHLANQTNRVLRDGGRIIVAETPLGGKEFLYALHMDGHDEGFILRTLSGMGIKEEELPNTNAEDLVTPFQRFLRWSRIFNWQGVYLFYGQKGGRDEAGSGHPPRLTNSVKSFLTPNPSDNSWDFLSKPEKAVWGGAVSDIVNHNGPRVWGTGNLMWSWFNHRNVTDAMYGNLMIEPRDKIMVICERMVPESLGVADELKKRAGENAEIEWVIMSPGGYDYDGWQKKRADYIARDCGEEWPYDFADRFPDDYFDLMFLPQGVHHSNNWLRDAPRLIRALKPGHQFIAIECGVNRPEHAAARDMSALVRLIVDRTWEWVFYPFSHFKISSKGPIEPTPQTEHVGRPYHDVSTAHLREACGDLLTDVYSLEKNGFILFWGYKK